MKLSKRDGSIHIIRERNTASNGHGLNDIATTTATTTTTTTTKNFINWSVPVNAMSKWVLHSIFVVVQ